MSGFEIWLYFVLVPGAGLIACVLGWAILAVCIALVLPIADAVEASSAKNIFRIWLSFFILGMLLVVSAALTPNKKEMAAIIAVPYITGNKEAQKLPNNIIKKLNDYLTDKDKDEG